MYFANGFVYGGEPAEPLKIVSVKVLDDMMMLIRFNNDEQRLFDASILKGVVFQSLKDKEVFNHPRIDHGVVTWMNGEIDCSPEYMFTNSYEYEQTLADI